MVITTLLKVLILRMTKEKRQQRRITGPKTAEKNYRTKDSREESQDKRQQRRITGKKGVKE